MQMHMYVIVLLVCGYYVLCYRIDANGTSLPLSVNTPTTSITPATPTIATPSNGSLAIISIALRIGFIGIVIVRKEVHIL